MLSDSTNKPAARPPRKPRAPASSDPERIRAVEVRLDEVKERLREVYDPVMETSSDIKEILGRMGRMEEEARSNADAMREEFSRRVEHDAVVESRIVKIEGFVEEYGPGVKTLHALGRAMKSGSKILAWLAGLAAASVAVWKGIRGT